MPINANSLLVFVHAPKTAGTTISRVLNLCSYRGLGQCQRLTVPELRAYATNADWLSGHLSKPDFTKALAGLVRDVAYFSSVREPAAQVLSLVNWFIEAVKRGIYAKHGVVARVHETDFRDPESIIRLLSEHSDELLNCQSRYIIGTDFSEISPSEFERRVTRYQYIAHENTLPELYSSFNFDEMPEGNLEMRENVSPSHFDGAAFGSAEVRGFLCDRNRFDEALYKLVVSHFGPCRRHGPHRSTEYACTDATGGNFDEERYFDANPELMPVVESKTFASGAEHFSLYGFAERRLLRSGIQDAQFSQLLRTMPPRIPPPLYGYVIPTSETFDEEGYLIANPDVLKAVKLNRMKSGRVHFMRFGRAEGRLMRVPARAER